MIHDLPEGQTQYDQNEALAQSRAEGANLTDVLCVDAWLSFSVDAECPHCKERIDIARDDPDTIVASAIFRNAWDDLKGYEVDCTQCGKQFIIGKVEY